jgi:oligopeptide/dipeptide ABC transporter ATP-binding protein
MDRFRKRVSILGTALLASCLGHDGMTAPNRVTVSPLTLAHRLKVPTNLKTAGCAVDESTSALDVVVQRQIMETIGRLQRQLNSSILLIGHDMGLMAQFVDRLAVMYAGRLVEVGPTEQLFRAPLHPYTQALISSLPVLGKRGVFRGIPGMPPSLLRMPSGCPFHPRCESAFEDCPLEVPPLVQVAPERWVACHLTQQTQRALQETAS